MPADNSRFCLVAEIGAGPPVVKLGGGVSATPPGASSTAETMASARMSLLTAGCTGPHRLQDVVTIGRVGHRREAYRGLSEGTRCDFTKSIKVRSFRRL
jgi:hypothetical protein